MKYLYGFSLRILLLTFFLLSISTILYPQSQHVNNGSFESSIIPSGQYQLDSCLGYCDSLKWPPSPNNCEGWYLNIIGKKYLSFYFHTLSPTNIVRPPDFGTNVVNQWPFDSIHAMIMLLTHRKNKDNRYIDSSELKRYRKSIVQSKLNSPLLKDSLYLVSYRISHSSSFQHSIKKMGAYFTKNEFLVDNMNTFYVKDENDPHYIIENDQSGDTLSGLPKYQLHKDGTYNNSLGHHWMLVRDNIIPMDSLNYITIGNFQKFLTWDDIYPTDTVPLNELNYDLSFDYFIDSVNVIGPIDQGENCNCSKTHFHISLVPGSSEHQIDTTKCCFTFKLESMGYSCRLFKIGYYAGDYDSNNVHYITPQFPLFSGDTLVTNSLCIEKSVLGANSEITFQMIGKNGQNQDSILCEIKKDAYCNCGCDQINQFKDQRFEITLEKITPLSNCDSCCCWDIYVKNNSYCHFTIDKFYFSHTYFSDHGYQVPICYGNSDLWTPHPDTVFTYYFENNYKTPFLPFSKNKIGSVCVAPNDSLDYSWYNMGLETSGSVICNRAWPGLLKCDYNPVNCCDSIKASLEKVTWDFGSDTLLGKIMSKNCCFNIKVSQFPTPNCPIYGVYIKDLNSQDTVYYEKTNIQNKPLDFNGDDGVIVDVICDFPDALPLGNYVKHIDVLVSFLDIMGNVTCSDTLRDSCVYLAPLPPGPQFPPVKYPEFEGEIYIAPNPVNDFSDIYFKTENPKQVNIYLTNSLGVNIEIVYSGLATKGINKFKFNNDNLPVGCYYIVVETDRGLLAKPLVIIK